MDEFIINDNTFRIKNMNAIELLALQTQYNFDDVDSSLKLFNNMLERMEVKCNNSWLPVKEKGKDIYYPANVENDYKTIKQLIGKFSSYLKSVFL